MIIPLLLASGIGYLSWKNSKKWQIAAGGFLVSWFVLWLITRNVVNLVTNKPYDPNAGTIKGFDPNTGTSVSNAGGTAGSVPVNTFNPDGWADALKKDIYAGPFVTRDHRLYEELAKLSTENLVKVYKVWQDKYYRLDKETMIDAMNGEAYGNGWAEGGIFGGPRTTDNVALIIAKLRSQGLN